MTKTLLFLTLMLVAAVSGAEEILFNNCMKLHANTENEPLCDRFRYQPSEEAKPESTNTPGVSTLFDDAKPGCPKIDCGLNNTLGKMCTTDKNGCAVYVEQSDAEKWKELCDKFIEAVREGVYDQTPVNHMKERLDFANVYCTRYNSALLEEMRNN